MRSSKVVFILGLLAPIMLASCATLNEQECSVADWYVIGLEDGSQGRKADYLGKHRSACAEYGLQPNVQQYFSGRDQGLLQYCTAQTGFNLGRSGKTLNRVCPKELSGAFESAFFSGREIYEASMNVNQIEKQIKVAQEKIVSLNKSNLALEAALLNGFSSPIKKREALDTIKLQQTEIVEIEFKLDALIHDKKLRMNRLRALEDSVPRSYF